MGKRRGIIAGLLYLFLLLLAGCGQKEYIVEYGVDGYVYPARRLQSMEDVDHLQVVGEYLYYMQKTDNGTAVGRVSVASLAAGEGKMDFSGKETLAVFRNITFELPEGAEQSGEDIDFLSALNGSVKQSQGIDMEKNYGRLILESYAVSPDGTLYFCLSASVGKYFEAEPAGGVLCRQNLEGEQSYQVYLPEMLDFAVDVEGRGMVLTGEGIRVLDQSGSQIGFLSTEAFQADEKRAREELFTDSEGRVYYNVINTKNIRTAYEVAGEGNLRLERVEGFPGEGSMEYSAAAEGNFFLYAPSTEGILYLYDSKENYKKEILNWCESGLLSTGIRSVAGVTPDILLVSYNGTFGGQSGIYQLTKTPVEELPEKELLVIASPLSSIDLQKAVMLFNAGSDTYRIVLDSYGAEYSDEEGWMCPQLDASLVSANPPDMLDLDKLNIAKYARMGVLEDLTPYLEGNSDLDMADALENLLEGLTFDGRLATIPTTFSIDGIVARAGQTEEFDSWTMEDVFRLSEQHPESMGGMVDDGYDQRKQRDWLLKEFCSHYYLEKFVDWERWECSFDSEEFRNLIAWAGKYGWEPEHVEGQMGAVFADRIYIPEEVLLVSQSLTSFTALAQLEMQFDEAVCLKGYPSVDGSGYFPGYVEGGLGIYANSPHKEAAWEFMEYYLQVSLESPWNYAYAPISKTKIRRRYENAITPNYTEDAAESDGEPEMKVKGYLYTGSDEMPYYVIAQDQADAIWNAMTTADFTPMSMEEEKIIQIVTEEAESYYNGDKSLEEVAALIQNRAQLLLNESKQ